MLSSVYELTLGLPTESLLLQLVHVIHPPSLSLIGLGPEEQKEWRASLDMPSSPEEQMELSQWIRDAGREGWLGCVAVWEGANRNGVTIEGPETFEQVLALCGPDTNEEAPQNAFHRLVNSPLVDIRRIEQECGPFMELYRFEVVVEAPSSASTPARVMSTGRIYVEARIRLRKEASEVSPKDGAQGT